VLGWRAIIADRGFGNAETITLSSPDFREGFVEMLPASLKFVPAAMLTALILPLIVGAPTLGSPAWAQPKVLAAVPAAAVAYVTRSTPKTLAAGMLALWFLQWTMR
jgi:branched-subunit amino acid transport protein